MRAFAPTTLCLAAAALFAGVARADDACHLHAELPATQLLRRTSLALVGRVPTLDEYEAVRGKASDDPVFETMVDGWLDGDAYRLHMRRYHMELLWASPDGADLRDQPSTLRRTRITGSPHDTDYLWNSPGRPKTYRGGDGSHICQDEPQTTLQPSYQLGDAPTCEAQGSDSVGPYCQEGWVELQPYWDPSSTVRVCAFEAQTRLVSALGDQPACDSRLGISKSDCGCGAAAQWCFSTTDQVEQTVWASWREQLLRLVDDYTRGQAPYRELLTTKRTYFDGVLTHYYRNLSKMPSYNKTFNWYAAADAPLDPTVEYVDATWYAAERTGKHSGILSLPAYLLRFQTNRGRANRFRVAFMGQYFVPSDGSTVGCTDDAADLMQRCKCRDCHQTLEPLAAYFGGFAEAGSAPLDAYLEETATYDECRDQSPPGNDGSFCNRFYIDLADPDVWRLRPLEWADVHPEIGENFDGGPAALMAEQALAPVGDKPYSYFAWSTVQHLWRFLVHRDLDLDPLSDECEQELLDELATEFEASDHDFRALVRRIATLPTFRRMP